MMALIDSILSGIGWFLGWLDKILPGNYMIVLFVFALIYEIILLPFSIKQQKNSIKQAMLRPKEQAIRKKYAGRNDQKTQQKVTEEIQELYQREKYNPLSGCLPMLLQLPIIMALYQVVINPLHYVLGVSTDAINAMTSYIAATVENGGLGLEFNSARGTIELISLLRDKGIDFFSGVVKYVDSGVEAVKDISLTGAEVLAEFEPIMENLPDFNVLGINLALTPTITEPSWLWLIPVLTFAVYFGSMKLNRLMTYQPTTGNAEQDKQAGCSNKVMDVMMPMMSVYITFIVPAAIGVYWIFKSIIGTIKQFIMSKAMPLPVFTEEDYKAAEKEYAGKAPKEKKTKVDVDATRNNPKSLFHMDDEDYSPKKDDDTAGTSESDATVTPEGKKSNGVISTAPLKDDKNDKNKKNS